MELDLHIHSNVSDGALDPAAVVALAARANLDVIALADHDTVLGVGEAVSAGRAHQVHVIPAVEVSVNSEQADIHILGYFVDPSSEALLSHSREAAQQREIRLHLMLERLAGEGVELSFEEVQAVRTAAPGAGTIGRAHLAQAMVRAGYVTHFAEAFDRYIGNERDAYVPLRLLTPLEAMGLIDGAGGIAVWAHPPIRHLRELLPELVECGLRGLEAYRPRTPPWRVAEIERIAREWGLLVSGGSDWHGPQHGELGEFRVSAYEVSAFLDAGGM